MSLPAPATAPAAFSLELAGLRVALWVEGSELAAKLPARYGAFLAPGEAAPAAFGIRCSANPTPSHGPWPYLREEFPGGFRLHSAAFRAAVHLPTRQAALSGSAETSPLDVLLRHLLPGILPCGVVLHAAGFLTPWGAFAALGASGAGKSTLAAILAEYACCDELVAVSLAETPSLHALPYWKARPGNGPLRALFLLDKAPVAEAVPLPHPAAALAEHVLWPTYDATAMARAFACFTQLLAQVPVFLLRFPPHRGVLGAILQALEKRAGRLP